MARTFEDRPAARERVPLLIGLVGPSGVGKTLSALRLATGFQRVTPGALFFIDTESRRALHYAPEAGKPPMPGRTFAFRHVPFGAPFGPLEYLAAIESCTAKGAKHIIIDSFSHEWEGVGGVLDMHEAEVERIAKGDEKKAERVKMLAWQKPKAQHRRLINAMLQMDVNFICCFRSKEKLKIKKGEEPEKLGFQAVAGNDLVYEMTLKLLLLPGADGVPTLQSEYEGERLISKVPMQFRELFGQPKQLTEDTGEALARWAQGDEGPPIATYADLVAQLKACSDGATFRAVGDLVRAAWPRLGKTEREHVRALTAETKARLAGAPSKEEKRSFREPGEDD